MSNLKNHILSYSVYVFTQLTTFVMYAIVPCEKYERCDELKLVILLGKGVSIALLLFLYILDNLVIPLDILSWCYWCAQHIIFFTFYIMEVFYVYHMSEYPIYQSTMVFDSFCALYQFINIIMIIKNYYTHKIDNQNIEQDLIYSCPAGTENI